MMVTARMALTLGQGFSDETCQHFCVHAQYMICDMLTVVPASPGSAQLAPCSMMRSKSASVTSVMKYKRDMCVYISV